jgi:hypothetical protein
MTECCSSMAAELSRTCELHGNNPFDCPDRVVYKLNNGDFGLIIHDDGSSFYIINYCPWCGDALSKRSR